MRPNMWFSAELLNRLPWQASWPIMNSRTMPKVISTLPNSFNGRLVARSASAAAAANRPKSRPNTTNGRSTLSVSYDARRPLRWGGRICTGADITPLP